MCAPVNDLLLSLSDIRTWALAPFICASWGKKSIRLLENISTQVVNFGVYVAYFGVAFLGCSIVKLHFGGGRLSHTCTVSVHGALATSVWLDPRYMQRVLHKRSFHHVLYFHVVYVSSSGRILFRISGILLHGWPFYNLVRLGSICGSAWSTPSPLLRAVVYRGTFHRFRGVNNDLVGGPLPVRMSMVHRYRRV